jgi:hypothetical protein
MLNPRKRKHRRCDVGFGHSRIAQDGTVAENRPGIWLLSVGYATLADNDFAICSFSIPIPGRMG